MIVTIKDDFDADKIMRSGQCFRVVQTEYGYRFITGSPVLYMKLIRLSTISSISVFGSIESMTFPAAGISGIIHGSLTLTGTGITNP